MQRNNYSEATKKKFLQKKFLAPDFFFWLVRSEFVVDDPRRLSPIFGLIDLEVGKESGALVLQKLEHRDRAATDLQLGALARSQLQHCPPGTGVRRYDDFRLGGVGKNSPRRLSRHFPAMDLVADPR